jgi:hypothetical protein
MNIFKIGLVLFTGAGFGFGVEKLADTEMFPNDNDGYGHMEEEGYYGHMSDGGCHGDGDFLEHMLEDLTDEELILVQAKIDELLVTYSITLEELNDDYDVRYDFMNDLMDFLEENDIDYHNHSGIHDHYNQDDEDGWYGGMGMH